MVEPECPTPVNVTTHEAKVISRSNRYRGAIKEVVVDVDAEPLMPVASGQTTPTGNITDNVVPCGYVRCVIRGRVEHQRLSELRVFPCTIQQVALDQNTDAVFDFEDVLDCPIAIGRPRLSDPITRHRDVAWDKRGELHAISDKQVDPGTLDVVVVHQRWPGAPIEMDSV